MELCISPLLPERFWPRLVLYFKKEELTVDPNLVATVRGADTERRGEGSLSAQPGSGGTVRGAVEVAEEKRMVQAETGCARQGPVMNGAGGRQEG